MAERINRVVGFASANVRDLLEGQANRVRLDNQSGRGGTCPSDPPCWPLLTDFAGVVADRERWPRHLCVGMMEESTERWASSATVVTAPDDWRSVWPLPLGTHAVLDHLRRSHEPTDQAALGWLPFTGRQDAIFALRLEFPRTTKDDERAPLVSSLRTLTYGFDGATLDLFGLSMGHTQAGDLDLGPRFIGPMVFMLRGESVPPEATSIVNNTSRWWGERMLGRSFPKGGRPKRRATGYSDDERREIARRIRDLRSRGVTWEAAAQQHGISADTAQRWVAWLEQEEPEPPAKEEGPAG